MGALPGLVFAFRVAPDGHAQEFPLDTIPDLAADPHAWFWLHFNLADKRACQLIATSAGMPEVARSLLIGLQDHQQLYATTDCIYGVFSDLVRDFDRDRAGEQTGYLNFAMTERLVITGRRQPLQAVEAVRMALAAGRRAPTAAALIEAMVEQATVGIDRLLENLAKELDRIEDLLLIDSIADERRRVGRVRRTGVRLHRQLAALRVLLDRFEISEEIAIAPSITIATDRLVQRLDALDQEVVSIQERARLLQEEIGSRLSEETNRSLNALAVITALFLPPTLVTGIFGMNTTALPFSDSHYGSAWAIGLAIGAAALAYWLLRRLGVIRR